MKIFIVLAFLFTCTTQAEGQLLVIDSGFSKNSSKTHALELMKKSDFLITPFTVLINSNYGSKTPLTEIHNHGDIVFTVIKDTCSNCSNADLIELNGLSFSEFVSTERQFHNYLAFKALNNNPSRYGVINISWQLGTFPWFSVYQWHKDFIRELRKQHVKLVISAGNSDQSISEYIRPFEENACLAYRIGNVIVTSFLKYFIDFKEESRDRFCISNNALGDWLIVVGLVNEQNKPLFSTPGKEKRIQKAYVAVNLHDIPSKQNIATSQATAFISAHLTSALKKCHNKVLVMNMFNDSIDTQFSGYQPSIHGRGVFRKKLFLDKQRSYCTTALVNKSGLKSKK